MVERAAYRPKEFAEAIGVNRVTVWRWIKAGEIPVIRLGSVVLIPAHILTCNSVQHNSNSVKRGLSRGAEKIEENVAS